MRDSEGAVERASAFDSSIGIVQSRLNCGGPNFERLICGVIKDHNETSNAT